MARKRKLTFHSIPEPIVDEKGSPADKHDLASLLVVNGLETFSGRLDAATQRAIIGYPVFGKRSVSINCNGQGSVDVTNSVSFGTMRATYTYSFADVITAAKERKALAC